MGDALSVPFIVSWLSPQEIQFQEGTNSGKTSDNCVFFSPRIFNTTSLIYFGWFCFKRTPTKCMRNTWVSVSSRGLCTGYPATHLSSHSVFQALISFFLWRYLKGKLLVSLRLLSISVNMVKNISIFFLRNIRNAVRILAVSLVGNFLYICSTDALLVADWWSAVDLITFG